jgi:hypothetical protein
LTNLQGSTCGGALAIEAETGGQLLLGGLQTIASGGVAFLCDGAGSVISLTNLSAFVLQNALGSVTAQNGGTILFNNQAFLLANVSISIPSGNPIIPPTVVAAPTLTLYGVPWHSYLVQERNNSQPNGPGSTFLVALTNAFEAVAASPPTNTAFLVTDFVANPAILQIQLTSDFQAQLVLFGLTNADYFIQSTPNLRPPITWTTLGIDVPMTNAFRIFSETPVSSQGQFYRAKRNFGP